MTETLEKILVSGGGTGGHIMPAVALCEEIREKYPSAKIYFAGRKNSMEERIAKQNGLDFYPVPSAPKGKGLRVFRNFFVNLAGFFKSLRLVAKTKPQAVAVFGGYTSAPLLLASVILGKNAVIHESNAIPGRVTRLMAKLGVRVACGLRSDHPLMTALKNSLKKENSFAITGNPLRKTFRQPKKDLSEKLPGLDKSKDLLLIFGGSQGAHNVNALCSRALPVVGKKFPELQVVHICGGNDRELLEKAYGDCGLKHWLFPFFEEMASLMDLATLCVARSGALSVTEICASRLPSVLVPLPCAADDHQTANARILEAAGAARLCPETSLDPEKLAGVITGLLSDREALRSMGEAGGALIFEDASRKLLDFITAV